MASVNTLEKCTEQFVQLSRNLVPSVETGRSKQSERSLFIKNDKSPVDIRK